MHSRQTFECSITSSGEKGAWGGEIAPSIGMATAMIDAIVEEFDIKENFISVRIVMAHYKEGAFH
jgi:hypothetical protein